MSAKVALVTGASSGIGEASARRLQDAGFVVYGAARRTDRMTGLAQRGIRTLALDVTDDGSIRRAIDEVIAGHGRIDVLVNNAGYGSYGALEDAPLTEARAQFDVNVFGLAALTRAVLPHMRAARSGRIVNISSIGGRFATPMGAWYHASKFAVEGLSDALRLELRGFGVDVVLVEPGSIRTEWGQIAADGLRAVSGAGAYANQAEAMASSLDESSSPDARRAADPEVVAAAIVRAATARRPRARYAVGGGAGLLIALHTILPTRLFDTLVKRDAGVPD